MFCDWEMRSDWKLKTNIFALWMNTHIYHSTRKLGGCGMTDKKPWTRWESVEVKEKLAYKLKKRETIRKNRISVTWVFSFFSCEFELFCVCLRWQSNILNVYFHFDFTSENEFYLPDLISALIPKCNLVSKSVCLLQSLCIPFVCWAN